MPPPPALPARKIGRFVEWPPVPVYRSVANVVPVPRSIRALAAVVGAPSELATPVPESDETSRTPDWIVVLPE
jgi:hypothetical protein